MQCTLKSHGVNSSTRYRVDLNIWVMVLTVFVAAVPALAYDAKTGSVYVAVATGNQILTIDKNNKTTVLAGTGVAGHANGQGTKAKFSDPHGVAVDKNGFVFVADRANHRVRVINPN